MWEAIKALSVPFLDFLKTLFDWSPLGLLVKHWEPITAYFKGLWDKLRPIVEPMMKFLGFSSEGGVIEAATNKVNAWTEQQKARNGAGQPAPGALVRPIAEPVQLMPEATSAASLLRAPGLARSGRCCAWCRRRCPCRRRCQPSSWARRPRKAMPRG
ncbi:hypothetical protein EGN69_15695 [Pseudomonas monteilii]|nr:hypothetical protein EGN69_15695 [Pseudomonas monteilii]